mmetsp:Transcript_16212/g.22140  ORF Transcript_16212/g.22140 Transcript_16212/m.22140 type:complete len:333 (+) Transcript_16212:232-1230(+)
MSIDRLLYARELCLGDFKNMHYFSDGSNCDIYIATYDNQQIIMKMLKNKVQNPRMALQEMISECDLLARLSHPNIVKILGKGKEPKNFIVLEYLSGGTLQQLLHPRSDPVSILHFSSIFHKKKNVLPMDRCLEMARDIASALKYLHEDCFDGAAIIHRDVKPGNIGFTADMQLKLFDLGLATCVKKQSDTTEVYEMTGYTGSLRYMAPEVALRKAYNEKVDVHSFGIILWEMLTGKLPFNGMRRKEYMSQVVGLGCRPKLPSNLPEELASLLQACWNADLLKRPSCKEIVASLSSIIHSTGSGGDQVVAPTASQRDPTVRKFFFKEAKSVWF